VEQELKKHVPQEYLAEAETLERVAEMARPVTEMLKQAIEAEALRLLKEGRAEEEIIAILASKYGLQLRKRRTKRANRIDHVI